jgi:hypothetical protein
MADEPQIQPEIEEPGSAGPDETVTVDEGTEPETQTFSDATLAMAQSYGLDADSLSGLDDAGAQRLFSGIDQRMMGRQPMYQPGNGQPVQQQQQMQQQQQQVQQPATQVPVFELGDLSEFEEPIANQFKAVGDYVNKTVGGMTQHLQAANQQIADMTTMMELSAFDSFVGSLGDEWTKDLGKGATLDLDPNSLQYQKRVELFQQGKTLGATHAQMFGKHLPPAEAWKRAWSGQYADRIGNQSRKQLSKDLKKRQALITERPQRGEGPATSPREAAEAAFRKT